MYKCFVIFAAANETTLNGFKLRGNALFTIYFYEYQ